MSNIINIKIDVSKIEEARLYKGKKGTYLDAVLIPSNGKYDDTHIIVQSVSKEEREQGIRGAIIGNGREFIKDSRQADYGHPQQMERPAKPRDPDFPTDDEDDVPF